MIILSVGMPRAGSGWHFNLIHDLMRCAASLDSHELRRRYHLEDILTEVNCNIGVLSVRRLVKVSIPALRGETFVIKAHSAPSAFSRLLQGLGLLRITYIYRDPRDAMLSAFEYGQRALRKGRPNAFSHLTDFDTSLIFIRDYVKIWEKWARQKRVLISRYEDLLLNYDPETARLVEFLSLQKNDPCVGKVIEEYRPGSAEGQTGLHFYKGKIGRFRQEYDSDQQARLLDNFGRVLMKMGYTT